MANVLKFGSQRLACVAETAMQVKRCDDFLLDDGFFSTDFAESGNCVNAVVEQNSVVLKNSFNNSPDFNAGIELNDFEFDVLLKLIDFWSSGRKNFAAYIPSGLAFDGITAFSYYKPFSDQFTRFSLTEFQKLFQKNSKVDKTVNGFKKTEEFSINNEIVQETYALGKSLNATLNRYEIILEKNNSKIAITFNELPSLNAIKLKKTKTI